METIKQRRKKVGTQYAAGGHGRGINTKNVYLIDGKYFAHHPKYANQQYQCLTGEFKGYISVNYSKSFNSFHQLGIHETHKQLTEHPHDLIEKGKKYDNAIKALKTAKQVIKTLHNKAHGNMGKHFWGKYQDSSLKMQRINKALKNGK